MLIDINQPAPPISSFPEPITATGLSNPGFQVQMDGLLPPCSDRARGYYHISLFNFWFRIGDLWRKSKRPGDESLKKALIGSGLSYLGLMLVIFFSFAVKK
jgi:hypothetical protein